MDPEKFSEIANDPRRTKNEIEQMRRNALDTGRIELAHIAELALNERFPDWARPRKRKGGATPTEAGFYGEQQSFPSAKEAYVWLLGKFINDRPDVLGSEDWRQKFITEGRAVNYFSKDKEALFLDSQHLASDPNMYTRVGGWFADLNLNNDQKFKILCRFAAVAEYRFEEDWNWRVEGEEQPSLEDLLR